MEQNKEAQHKMASWTSVIDEIKNIWFGRLFLERGGIFLGNKKYTGRVHFESHWPKWRVLSKFSFQHCYVFHYYCKEFWLSMPEKHSSE